MISDSRLRVLMFGWELPPFNSGGLGVACWGLSKALALENVDITFVLPQKTDIRCDFMKIIFASNTKDAHFYKRLKAYTPSILFSRKKKGAMQFYSSLFEEVMQYANRAADIAKEEQFDIIHAHDWLTFEAGLTAQDITNKPLVTHVHATEFDRTGHMSVNQDVYDIERKGIHLADSVITVSNLTKHIVTHEYSVPSDKVDVVHNGVEKWDAGHMEEDLLELHKHKKIVLFVGRLTLQKGPDYFIQAAKKVLEYDPDVFFVIAGSGDMKERLVTQVASLGISDHVIFTGFLRDAQLRIIYKSADLFVMPSVSEPFGITGLESAINGTPVIVSRQSGVSEVLTHALKIDFWDIDEMTNKILSVLKHGSLKNTLRENGQKQAENVNWQHAAKKVKHIYKKTLDKKKSQA